MTVEEKALEAYPVDIIETYGMIPGGGIIKTDLNEQQRRGFVCGYRRAIKDAVEWINNNAGAYVDYEAPKYGSSVELDKDSMIEDFKLTMKGE